MNELQLSVITLLEAKDNSISNKIIEEIGLFSEQELLELKLMLEQTCTDKLKQALDYKNEQLTNTIDKITEIWTKVYELDKHYKQKLIEDTITEDFEDITKIEEDIELNLEQAYIN